MQVFCVCQEFAAAAAAAVICYTRPLPQPRLGLKPCDEGACQLLFAAELHPSSFLYTIPNRRGSGPFTARRGQGNVSLWLARLRPALL